MKHVLHVQKRAQAVRVLLEDGNEVSATIFLPFAVDAPLSGLVVAEAVEDSAPVLPCEGEDGSFVVLGTAAIAAVAVPAADTWDDGLYDLRAVHVTLRGGHALEGFLRHYAGTGDRLSDALRRPDEWVQVEMGDDVIWFRVDDLLLARETGMGRDE